MSTESEIQRQPKARVVCPKCLLSNLPTAAFCADCGAPIGMVATIDPIQQIQAEGFAYRSAVDGPPRLIIVVGMWLLFAPAVLAGLFFLFGGLGGTSLPETTMVTLFAIASAVILYRTTKNYVVRSRSANHQNA